MAYIPVPDTLQAELVYNWDGQIVENVLHFKPFNILSLTLMQELGLKLVGWWIANIKGITPTNLQLVNVKITDLTTQTSPTINYATSLPSVGTGGSPSLPNNCAVVLTKRTLLRGRSFRGRIYHPGLYEAIVVGNTVDAGAVVSFINAYTQLKAFPTATTTWEMVVVSKFQNKVPLLVGVTTPVLSLDSDGVVDSQRRRLPRRGA